MNRRRGTTSLVDCAIPLAMTLACGVGFVLVYVITVRTAPGREFGDASLRGAALTKSGAAEVVDRVLAIVSVASLLAGAATVSMIALVRLQRIAGLIGVGLLVVCNASTWLLKTQLLSRPDLGLGEITPATHNSLPSGHTTAVFAVVVALLIVVPPRLRPFVGVAGGVAAVVTALATMSAGWHRAGDSMAAFLLVGTWAGVAGIVGALASSSEGAVGGGGGPRPTPAHRSWGRLRTITLLASGGGLLLALALAMIRPLRTSTVGELLAFVVGGVLIVATAVAVLAAERWVLGRASSVRP